MFLDMFPSHQLQRKTMIRSAARQNGQTVYSRLENVGAFVYSPISAIRSFSKGWDLTHLNSHAATPRAINETINANNSNMKADIPTTLQPAVWLTKVSTFVSLYHILVSHANVAIYPNNE